MYQTRCLRLVLLILSYCCLSGCGLDTPQYTGEPDEKLDIVLVPSHHYGSDLGEDSRWISDTELVMDKLLTHPFFSLHRDRMNIFRLNNPVPNDFHTSRLVPDINQIRDHIAGVLQFMDYEQGDQIVFITHSENYRRDAGERARPITRGDPNITQIESNSFYGFIHEFGHAFGRLGDEYDGAFTRPGVVPDKANIASDHTGNTCQDKWGDLIGVEFETPGTWVEHRPKLRTVGCFDALEEESPGNRFKPSEEGCVMKNGDAFPFCPVCERELERLLERYTL